MNAGNTAESFAAQTVTLTAEASEPGTEIFVIDSHFRRVENGKGVGRLELALAPGVYSVKFKAGDAIREMIKPVFMDTRVVCPPLAFASPAPIAGSSASTLHLEHQKAAQTASQKVHVTLEGKYASTPKKSAQIFVFVRDLAPNQEDGPCSGMALCDLETGDVLVDLPGMGEFGPPDFPYRWKGCTIALKPGGYRLRVTTRSLGRLEQVVVARHDWQTQLFLLRREFGGSATGDATEQTEARADLCGGALFMSPIGSGWQGGANETRLTELARQALDTRRARVVSPTDLQTMLNGSRQNPMLGLYASHLLLLSPTPDLDLLQSVTDALRDEAVLGNHPDVEALRLKLPGGVEAAEPFVVPPTLRRGGDLLTEATVVRPGLVPETSLAARAAPTIWGDGVWLVARNVPDVPASAVSSNIDALSELLDNYVPESSNQAPPHPDSSADNAALWETVGDVFHVSGRGTVATTRQTRAIDADTNDFIPQESEMMRIAANDGFTVSSGVEKLPRPAEQAEAAPQTFEEVLSQAAQAATTVVKRAEKKIARATAASKAGETDADLYDDQAEQAAWQARKAVREIGRAYNLPPLETNLLGMLYGKEKSDLSPADLIGALRVPHATLQTAALSLSQTLSKPPPRKKKS